MVKAAEKLVLQLESAHHTSGDEAGPHDLQRNASLRPLLFGLVDDAHAALPD